MIPPRRNRVDQRTYDEHLYKERHLVECFINKMKWYRRIFSRFEKLAARYFGFLSFVVLSPLLSGSVEMSTEPRQISSVRGGQRRYSHWLNIRTIPADTGMFDRLNNTLRKQQVE